MGNTRDEEGLHSFEEILGEHLDALFAAALRLTGGREADAEDLFQDMAVKAFQGFSGLKEEKRARSWLFTILNRTHLNRERGGGRRPDRVVSGEQSLEELLRRRSPPDTGTDALDRLAARLDIMEAFDRLPEEFRSVVWLVDVEEFLIREVAEMLEIPEGTAASRLYRGRRKLRSYLGEAGGRASSTEGA